MFGVVLNPARNYMFKVNNRNTRIHTLFIHFTPCFSVSIVIFEQVNAGW